MKEKSKKNLNTLNIGQASNYKFEAMNLKTNLMKLSRDLASIKRSIKEHDQSGLSTRDLAYTKKYLTEEIVKISETLKDLKSKTKDSVSDDIEAIKNFFKERNKLK